MKVNGEYLRYILNEYGYSTLDIADKLSISRQGFNQRVKNNKLYISDVFVILDLLNLPFEDVFKYKKLEETKL